MYLQAAQVAVIGYFVLETTEEAVLAGVDALERVVVGDDAPDAAVLGESPRLRLDLLAATRRPPGSTRGSRLIAEVTGQLLDTVDLPATLDLDRDRRAGGVGTGCRRGRSGSGTPDGPACSRLRAW